MGKLDESNQVRSTLDNLKQFLQEVKEPKIDPDRGECIEQEVGDSVVEAYDCGFRDGWNLGRYKIAQQLLKMLN